MKEKLSLKEIKTVFVHTIPVMAGYIVLGMGFGLLLKANGYGILWAFLMSLLVYAGSMQYLAVDLIAGGASLITVALTTLMVNARHLFYGISMIAKYRNMGKERAYDIFALTDETYSLVCRDEIAGIDNKRSYYFFVSLFNQCYWLLGSIAGSAVGSVLKINTKGIDFALTALFLTVATEQWLSTDDHSSALIGLGMSVLSLVIFGSDGFLIPAMLAITAALSAKKYIGRAKHE